MQSSKFFKKLVSLVVFCGLFFCVFPNAVYSAYTISVDNFPTTINANSEADVDLNISAKLGNSSDFYLRGSFSHPNSSSAYFGYTNGYNGTDPGGFYKIATDGVGNWNGILKIRPDVASSNFKGEGNYNFKIGYYTSTGNSINWEYTNSVFLSYTAPTPIPTVTPTSTPAPTTTPTPQPTTIPTSTLTPASEQKATYKINKAKDSNGAELSSVKIYVDDVYIHHLDEETLTFCSGCHCDDEKVVDCELGQHTIRTEKDGYENWQETRTLNSGDSYEVNPVMAKIVPSSTPAPTATPVPTLAPTPTSTMKPSLTPTKSPTPSLSLTPIAGEVLGEEIASKEGGFRLASGGVNLEGGVGNEVKNAPSILNKNSRFILPGLAIVLGLAFVGFSIFSFIKSKRSAVV